MGRKRKKSVKTAHSPGNRKVPKYGETPPTGKQVNVGFDPSDFADDNPVWTVSLFDVKGPWGRGKVKSEETLWAEILPKLRDYERMTWKQIDANRRYNHPVPVSKIIPDAKKRLSDLNLDDYERLYRLRLGSRLRLWGIRDRNILRLLWWDPDHEICPSRKGHT
ncbi:MAG: hypothetical protein HQ581_12255 [Planctomycetes bacterium]|nr:hypothetical protein [Planctomycetota bacterium]